MLIALKRLKIRTSNLAGVFPGIVPTWSLTNVSKKWAWSRSRDPVNFCALNANSSKTAADTKFFTNFKFGRRVPSDSPDITPDKCFQKVGVVMVTVNDVSAHMTTEPPDPCSPEWSNNVAVILGLFLFIVLELVTKLQRFCSHSFNHR